MIWEQLMPQQCGKLVLKRLSIEDKRSDLSGAETGVWMVLAEFRKRVMGEEMTEMMWTVFVMIKQSKSQ